MKKQLNLITEALLFYICRALISVLWFYFFIILESIFIFSSVAWYYHIINFCIIIFFLYYYIKNLKLFHSLNIRRANKK